jgi:polyhydroxybutyrate depolymerase
MERYGRLCVLFALLATAAVGDGKLFGGGVRRKIDENLIERSIPHAGLTRWFLEYRPVGYVPSVNNSALVLLLHGGTNSMRVIFEKNRPGSRRWIDLSDDKGLLLLAPNAVNIETGDTYGDNQNWNDYRKLHGDKVDDTGFLAALVRWAISERGVNPKRVYITGASNGGMMSYRASIESSPPIYAATAAFIANLPQAAVPDANHSTPMFIMNGDKDRIIKWDGGPISDDQGTVRSAPATRDYWIKVNGVDKSNVQRSKLPNRNWLDGCRISSEFYPATSNANNSSPVQFYRMEGGGHMTPYTSGERYSFLYRILAGPACREVEGADVAWEFMSKFSLPEL